MSVPPVRIQELQALRQEILGFKLAEQSSILNNPKTNGISGTCAPRGAKVVKESKRSGVTGSGADIATKELVSIKPYLLDYYPPDVDVHKLAKQDASLNHLGLKDVRFEELKDRELAKEARGKHIRVSGKVTMFLGFLYRRGCFFVMTYSTLLF